MGNAIRLGIARVGLAISQCTKRSQPKSKADCVILILGLDKAGKTTIASLISNGNKTNPITDTTYVPTNGFSIYEVKSKTGVTKLYDLGGSESIRELWKHYYSDAHGFIYVIDSASTPAEIQKSTQVFAEILQDERVKGKPILILANKQDVSGAMSELDLTSQMDIVRLVNTAKCLTRMDTSSATNLTQLDGLSDNGLYLGFRWLTSLIKHHWSELNDRVEHDSLVERSREKAKFEASREQPVPEPEAVQSVPPPPPIREKRNESGKSIKSYKSGTILPAKRLDPEGGNEEMVENHLHLHAVTARSHHHNTGDESSEDVDMSDDIRDGSASQRQVPEIMIVEAKAQVHKADDSTSLSQPEPPTSPNIEFLELPPSPILETKDAFANHVPELPDPLISVEAPAQPELLEPVQPVTVVQPDPPVAKTTPTSKPTSASSSGSKVGPPVPRRMKVFKNKTAPLTEIPAINSSMGKESK